ncbi:DNA polymerase III subunit chi [Paraurantiacibacter namhicola]|uniref:DNA polymerase III subunit chi n=1 Tax=Paraurantiacibacter namhicola TaxID=645517 RepID=A0A1C7DA67_9SPHN|nr:DNA polymerase III subunit chi [Paraurantiacibacter namhicola]ANU08386.1 DNA polymerase III subunit chi [Paraurantiacibacter namhicola]
MKRVDFYQLSRDPAERVVPLIARATKNAGERALVVSGDAEQIDRIDKALWEMLPDAFLAHGRAGEPHAARQPLLLSMSCEAENEARFILLADGAWRDEAFAFERAFLIFGESALDGARACWRMLGEREDTPDRHFWLQDGSKWREGP